MFRDELLDGPFERWAHTHRFEDDGDGTIVTDTVVYELPDFAARIGRLLPARLDRRLSRRIERALARSLTPLAARTAGLALAVAFAGRHRQTSRLLEDF